MARPTAMTTFTDHILTHGVRACALIEDHDDVMCWYTAHVRWICGRRITTYIHTHTHTHIHIHTHIHTYIGTANLLYYVSLVLGARSGSPWMTMDVAQINAKCTGYVLNRALLYIPCSKEREQNFEFFYYYGHNFLIFSFQLTSLGEQVQHHVL